MSHNLTLHDAATDRQIDLWQTPTYITEMCLSCDERGQFDGGQEGIRRRYLRWVQSHSEGMWKSKEDLDNMRLSIAEHTAEVMAVEKPDFSWI